jgi:spore maturation protein CgeB
VFKGPFVTADALRAIKESGTVCYCYYPDVSTTTHGPYLPLALREHDWIFTTKSFGALDLQQLYGIERVSYLPHAFDPMVHNPQELSSKDIAEYGCEASFIGSWSRKKQSILEGLVMRRPGLRLKIWGNGWESLPHASPLKRFVAFRAVTGIAYAAAISCSKINLGLLYEGPPEALSGDKITSRSFHIPACGGLLLHERTEDFLEIFTEGVNCVCFDGCDELTSQVDTLLNDQSTRLRIAAAGYKLVRDGHSWDHRIRTILDHYFNARAGRQYEPRS